jgi:hypothetical protein
MSRLSPILIVALAGCGSSASYVPEHATTSIGGNAATIIAIPPEAPQGQVRVASSGITTLRAQGAPDLRAVHLQMVVSNDADTSTWTVDTRQQLLDVDGTHVPPAFATADTDGLPLVQIAPRENRTLDLYFPVHGKVGQFDLSWQVHTGDRLVGQRTAFFKQEAEYGPTYATVWGPYWWYDPFYPRYHIYVSGRVIGHHHHGFVVRRNRG